MSYGEGKQERFVPMGENRYHTVIERWTGVGEPPEGKELHWILLEGWRDFPLVEVAHGYGGNREQCLEAGQRALDEHRERS